MKWVILNPGSVKRLLNDGKLTVIERKSLRPHLWVNSFPYPTLRLFQGAVVAIRVITSAIKEDVCRPSATATA
jgi:hypothetical protein